MESNTKIAVIAIVIAAGAFCGGLLTGYSIFTPRPVTLKLAGSTTVYPIATDAADVFMNLYPNYNVLVSAGGSGVGVAACLNGTCDIGMSSRNLTSTEISEGLNVTKIALDGIAIIINSQNSLTNPNFTITQVKEIYNGTITNWDSFPGGANHAIDIYERESGSGTRSSFETFVIGSPVTYASGISVSNGSPAMNQSVATDQYGIGYIGIGYLNPAIAALNIAKTPTSAYIKCSVSTVKSGVYPLSRSLFMFVKGVETPVETAFLNFMVGPLGQQSVVRQGFVSLR